MDTETKDLLERILVGVDAGFARCIQRMDARFEAFGAEMRDGFRSVDERLSSIGRDVAALSAESRAHTAAIGGMSERVAELSERVSVLSRRQDTANAEVSQRLRVVIERIAALEHTHRSS